MDKETAKRLLAKGVDPSIILDELLGEDDAPAVVALQPEEPAAEVKPAEVPEENRRPDPDPILAAIEKLTGVIQAGNSRTRSFDAARPETTDDILAAALGGRP